MRLVGIFFLFSILAEASSSTPQIYLSPLGGCTLIQDTLKCWGEGLVEDIVEKGAVSGFSKRTGSGQIKDAKDLIGSKYSLFVHKSDFSILDLTRSSYVKELAPLHYAASHYYRFTSTKKSNGEEEIRIWDSWGDNPGLQISSELHKIDAYENSYCLIEKQDRTLRCFNLVMGSYGFPESTEKTPYAFKDLTDIHDVKIGDEGTCLIWGPERRLVCARAQEGEPHFPRLKEVHSLTRVGDGFLCAIHGPRGFVDCFSPRSASGMPNEASCEKSGTYNPLVGQLAIEDAVAVAGNDRGFFQQVCALVKNDPVPVCWTHGCGNAKWLSTQGWREKELPDWHPEYHAPGYARFQGDFKAGAPMVTLPPPKAPAGPVPPAPAPAPVGKKPVSGFEDL